MTVPKLVRIRRTKSGIVQDCDVYIGRANNQGGWNLPCSKWHNPFTIKKYGSVDRVCQLYLNYIIWSDLFHDIPELDGKTIGCWCEPTSKITGFFCHGCVLIQLFKLVERNNGDTHFVQSVLQKMFVQKIEQ